MLKKSHGNNLNEGDVARVIEMAWEDRTAFEAIEAQFKLNQDGVIKLMRANLKLSSFKLWRKRTRGQTTKHLSLRVAGVDRHQSKQHNKLHK
ncbi:MAG: TIGR03643 family protein [Methylotenera sp.]|nr:TIGR03643 family protein [Methylotenera sp.]